LTARQLRKKKQITKKINAKQQLVNRRSDTVHKTCSDDNNKSNDTTARRVRQQDGYGGLIVVLSYFLFS